MAVLKDAILENWELINRLAVKRFGSSPLAEEAALNVMDQLVENEGARLSGYERRGSFAGFLGAVTWRLLEDFSRKRFGRKRAPLWIRNLGGIWPRLFELLCLQRRDIDEAVALIEQEQPESLQHDPEESAWIIRQQIIDCGSHQGLEVELDEAQPQATTAHSTQGDQVEYVERQEREELFRMLFHILTDLEDEVVETELSALRKITVNLDPEEKVLLKLCYQDNLSVTKAGELLGLNRHQVHGRLRRLLRRIKEDFQRTGLSEELLEMLS